MILMLALNLYLEYEQVTKKPYPNRPNPKKSTVLPTSLRHLSSTGGGSSSGQHVLLTDGGLNTDTLLGEQVNQQRAGTAVTLGVETGLVVLVLENAVQVDVEEVRGVQRTALGLRVELGAEDGARLVDHTLVALVVEVDEVGLPVRGKSGSVNSVSVVLTGDVAATSAQVKSGDVVSTVSVLELDGASTGGQSEELVTQADTEDGDLGGLHKTLEVVDGVLAVGGVTGAVGDEDTIEVVGDLVDGVVEGKDSDAGATANQAAENVLLDTAVNDGNVRVRVGSGNVEGLLGADLTNQVNLLGVSEGLILVGVVLLADSDTGKRRTLLTQVGNNGTSVNTRDSRHTLTSTPLAQTLDGSPVTVLLGDIGDDDTSSLQVGRLEVLQESIGVLLGGGDTVVADQRLGENQNLTTVGGIGQGLGVTDQGGGEDSLAGDVGAGTEGLSGKHRTITDSESSWFHSRTLAHSGHETHLSRTLHGGEGSSPRGHSLEEIEDHFFVYG